MVNEPPRVEYRGIIVSFNLAQKPLAREKLMAKMQSSIRTGVSFGGPQTEPDPESVRVYFNVENLQSFGEISITRESVKKHRLMVEDEIVIVVRRLGIQTEGSDNAAEMHGIINAIMADPASPLHRRRAYESLSKMYPFVLPQVMPEQLYKATEQEVIDKPSDLVRLEILDQVPQIHGTLPIRKDDLKRLDLFTGDGVAITIRKDTPIQEM